MGNNSNKLFKQGGQKPVDIDPTSFKPKLFYDDSASQQEILEQIKLLQDKQKQLKKYKYFEDLDRIDYSGSQSIPRKQQHIQRRFYLTIVFSLFVTSILSKYLYGNYYSVVLTRRMFPKTFLGCASVFTYFYFLTDASKVQNEDIFFRNLEGEIRTYVGFDQKINLYKYVDDIKYQFKYPSHQEYDTLKANIKQARSRNYNEAVFKMWRERYGKKKRETIEQQN